MEMLHSLGLPEHSINLQWHKNTSMRALLYGVCAEMPARGPLVRWLLPNLLYSRLVLPMAQDESVESDGAGRRGTHFFGAEEDSKHTAAAATTLHLLNTYLIHRDRKVFRNERTDLITDRNGDVDVGQQSIDRHHPSHVEGRGVDSISTAANTTQTILARLQHVLTRTRGHSCHGVSREYRIVKHAGMLGLSKVRDGLASEKPLSVMDVIEFHRFTQVCRLKLENGYMVVDLLMATADNEPEVLYADDTSLIRALGCDGIA